MAIELVASSEIGPNPQKFYAVARAPGLIAGMSYPSDIKWQSLHDSGYHLVVCLTEDRPAYNPAPLALLYASRLQDLAGGALPDKPDHDERCIREAVALIRPRVLDGQGVAVHCAGGTGRTGTVIACTLKALGLSMQAILEHMKTVNESRAKSPGWSGWPESPWQKELLDRF